MSAASRCLANGFSWFVTVAFRELPLTLLSDCDTEKVKFRKVITSIALNLVCSYSSALINRRADSKALIMDSGDHPRDLNGLRWLV